MKMDEMAYQQDAMDDAACKQLVTETEDYLRYQEARIRIILKANFGEDFK
jgi:hypothetical protein